MQYNKNINQSIIYFRELLCEKLYDKGIISYKTIHEDPEFAYQDSGELYPPLCEPWTDTLIPKPNSNSYVNTGGAGGIYQKTTMKEVGKDGVSRSVYIKGKTRYVKRMCPDGTYKYKPLRTK
jgi:hypothetical protein